MKFWELVSGFRSEPELLQRILADRNWGDFSVWYGEFREIVARQDRQKLDAEIPGELELAVASGSSQVFCLRSDDCLESASPKSCGEILSALDVVKHFGGAMIEELNEYGSAHVGTKRR
ncbi:MAG: hypothetical protein K8T91_26805 [Planctomycetes bacterium]|nr:hypothetical protein [Planctomycetota bacterium]